MVSDLQMKRGDTPTIRVRNVVDADENPVDLTDDWAVTFTARNPPGTVTITKTLADGITVSMEGADILLASEDTTAIESATRLKWDVEVRKGSAVHTIESGKLDVLLDVTVPVPP